MTSNAELVASALESPRRGGSIITLLTDFGCADYFVGAVKGVILSINPQVRIVDLTPREWTVTTGPEFPVIFVEQGALRLRIGLPNTPPLDLSARVHALSRGESHLLYALRVEYVADPDRYRELVDGVRRVLGL